MICVNHPIPVWRPFFEETPRITEQTYIRKIESMEWITVQHGSADTVVRAMNTFNGKWRFSGFSSSEIPWPIFKKNGTVDYVGDPTPHARIGVNRFKGGVSAHAWNCHPQASIFSLWVYLHWTFRGGLRKKRKTMYFETECEVAVQGHWFRYQLIRCQFGTSY